MMNDYLARFNALAARERGLILGAAVVILYLILDALLLTPILDEKQRKRAQIEALQSEEQRLAAEFLVLSGASTQDPDVEKKQQIAALRQQLLDVDNALSELSAGLIPARDLTRVLQQMLTQSQTLQLHSIRTLETEQLSLQDTSLEGGRGTAGNAFTPSGNPADDVIVYRHPVELNLSGGYMEIRGYLQRLESLPWKLYWDELQYRVEEHPRADVRLRVYTLSTEQGAFGD